MRWERTQDAMEVWNKGLRKIPSAEATFKMNFEEKKMNFEG